MHKTWWKIICIFLLIYTFTAGLLFDVPYLPILEETIRNLYFHVGMWFAMMLLFTVSVIYAVLYLKKLDIRYDVISRHFAVTGILFGLLGYATGAIWASFTWADPNNSFFDNFKTIVRDPKLIGAAISLFVYFAYLILRDSVTDPDKKARISAVYNIFAYALLFPALWIIPRILPSLHPGQEGNPALDVKNDISAGMRIVFYPAVIGWTLLGVWIATLKIRMTFLKNKLMFE
ncbi:MAG: cytochrome c biogenesis protein [Chitinophagaceae bacterium]|nr:cytochrome c biogenesis protein [Chitinophagaceae bacterium]